MLRRLNGHPERVVLCNVVLRVADVIAEHHFRCSVDHFIDAGRTHFTVFILVVEIQLGAVTVPQRVAARRQGGLVLAVEALARFLFAVYGVIP